MGPECPRSPGLGAVAYPPLKPLVDDFRHCEILSGLLYCSVDVKYFAPEDNHGQEFVLRPDVQGNPRVDEGNKGIKALILISPLASRGKDSWLSVGPKIKGGGQL